MARVHDEDLSNHLAYRGIRPAGRPTRFCVNLGERAMQVLGELTRTSSSQEDARRSSSSAAIMR